MTAVERHISWKPDQLKINLIGAALILLSSLVLGGCGGGPSVDKKSVGPEGGLLSFRNGIVLEVPPGAVSEDTEIWISVLSCDEADPALAAAAFRTSEMGCLAGFSAGPDGLTFAVPLTASIPVELLETGQIPVQAQIDAENNGVRLSPTDLVYDGGAGIIELKNITHFSKKWMMALYQNVENNCRRCETFDNYIDTVNVDGEEKVIYQTDLCNAYAKDVWANLQPGCCLLLREEREKCYPDCDCCMEKLIEVESSGVDLAFGDCGIVSSDVQVRYPACPSQPVQGFSESGTTPECPDDMTLAIDVQPASLTLDIGESKNLNDVFLVTLSGTTPDGRTAFGPDQLLPRWESQDPGVAAVGSEDVVCGVDAGATTLEASLSGDPAMPTGEVAVVVNPRGIDGIWQLRPRRQEESCRYNGGEWFDEDPFGGFDIQLTAMDGDEITASIVGAGSVMAGTWDSTTGEYNLAVDTSQPTECVYLFDLYGEDLCGDAVDCAFAACRNMTAIEGELSRGNTNLTANVQWYYSISFSFATGIDSVRGTTTWECEGSSVMSGSTKMDSCK